MYEHLEAFIAPSPTGPKKPSDTAFPTVVPDPIIVQEATAVGVRTLAYV